MNAKKKQFGSSPAVWIAVGLIVVVGLAAVLAVALGGGGDDAASPPSGKVQEIQPVEVKGSPLPLLPQDGSPDAAIGMMAPQLSGFDFASTPTKYAPGKPTMLVFVAHWCPHCQAEVPRLVKWHHALQVPDGLDIIAVSTATSSQQSNYPPSAWLTKQQWPWPVIVDDAQSTAFAAYNLKYFPGIVLLDADGKVAYRMTGEIGTDDLGKLIEQYLGLAPKA